MATAQPQAPTDLALYGGRDEVKELGARLQNYMPNAQQFTNVEAQAVAQIAVAHGLDPFNGEVWGIKGDGKWYGVMVGIKGLRKCAHRQADLEGGHYWIDTSYASPKDYGEPESSVVAICVLRDTRSMKAYAESLRALRDCGMPYEDAKKELGDTPRIVGVGIATVSERSKMKINQRAMKRAEADAIKKRFDVSFGMGVYTENDKEVIELAQHAISTDEADGYQDGYVSEVEEVQATPEPPKRTEGQNLAALGFGEPEPPAPAKDAPKYKANGTKIVEIVATVVGCEIPAAVSLILSKYKASDMLTEQEARDFAAGQEPAKV